jgi:RNA polymerase sigma factor (TIGR02999 family)
MAQNQGHEITILLKAWASGDEGAFEDLYKLVEPEIRQIVHGFLSGETRRNELRTTDLIDQTFEKLILALRRGLLTFENRKAFLALFAIKTQQLLKDAARGRNAQKRGSGAIPYSLAQKDVGDSSGIVSITLDIAVDKLKESHPLAHQVFVFHILAERTIEATASLIGIGRDAVIESKKFAKAFLASELGRHEPARALRLVNTAED